MKQLKSVPILGVNITNDTTENICHYVFDRLHASKEKWYVVTPNPEMLVYANKHASFKKILNGAGVALPDGVGVFVIAGLMGNKLKERIPGVDFLEELCKKASGKPVSIGFLGGGPGVARLTAECLLTRYPGIKVRWVGEEWINVRHEKQVIHSDIDDKNQMPYVSPHDPIDILFVAFGAPKQEKWIAQNLPHLPVKMAMGVGGSFDYISGNVVRAPFMIRAIGFEWLFRLIVQPWRIKRQLALLQFIWLSFRAALMKSSK